MWKSTPSMNNHFIYFNANPDRKLVIDCTVRAISFFTGLSWEEVYDGICAEGRLQHNMPSSNAVWSSYLKKMGYTRIPLPNTCPYCYSVTDFCLQHPFGTYLLALYEHVVAVKDGYYYDTWDSGDEIVLYYWRKE